MSIAHALPLILDLAAIAAIVAVKLLFKFSDLPFARRRRRSDLEREIRSVFGDAAATPASRRAASARLGTLGLARSTNPSTRP